ncbi:MAG: proline dehydrogenase family protein [Pseudobdellovibrionaceae bacterium]
MSMNTSSGHVNSNTANNPDLQKQILLKGEEILKRMESNSKSSLFSKDFWYGSIMEMTMKNDKFKTNMFRFVDVLPSLNSGSDVHKHIKEYFSEGGDDIPSFFKVGVGLGSLAPGLMAGAIKKNVTSMAKMFITGEDPQESLIVLKKARKAKLAFTVDILGEATLSEKEALDYQRRYLELISWLAKDAETWEEIPQIDQDHEGRIPKVNVSVKMTALFSQINDKAWDQTKTTLKERLRPILRSAMEKNVFLNLDMEQYSVKHLTLEVFQDLLLEPEFKSYRHFGCVIQAYLTDSFQDVQDMIQFAKKRGTPLTIRLVKGAYWDYETVDAAQKSWAIPVYTIKAESDWNYERCAILLLDHHQWIRSALASHNVRSLAAALVHAEKLNLPKNAFEIQMLYGMAEPIKKSFVEMGYRVREYAPVGELIPGMAYLVRRLLENTSNESWLRGKFADGKTTEQLLQNPLLTINEVKAAQTQKNQASANNQASLNQVQNSATATAKIFPKNYINEPLIDFALENHRNEVIQKIQQFKLNQIVVPVINGQKLTSTDVYQRPNPSNKSQIVAQVQMATVEQAEKAIQTSHQAFATWKKVPAATRADYIFKLAELMRKKRYDLIATQVFEVGKPWSEADADVGEAIDFCTYYAEHMKQIANPLKVGNAPGEITEYIYKPRGVSVVIAPWNFPLAILTGQVVSALVTGNTVVMKPAEQSSLVAAGLMQMILDVGIPANTVQFLPGYGEVVGEYLVQHPLTTTIAFTGSKAVGLHILKAAAVVKEGQQHVKRCIIEMGGKNAVVIDSDADLDEAVDGVLYSAFGFSGQKCSAASRCIVLEEVYEKFAERLVEAAKSIQVSAATLPIGYTGPVVDEDAYLRIQNTIATAKSKNQLLFEAQVSTDGYFVSPTIFGNVDSQSDLAQKEIFGPVLALIKAKNMDEAITMLNSTEYALTGGLFSRSPENIKKFKIEAEVGNLYVNRGITGAMVDRHPFGGFKMSGIGSKTGGPDYLKQFMEPIAVTENTLRRGFAPTET